MAWSEPLDFSGTTLSGWSLPLDFHGETLGPGTVTLVAPLADTGLRITAIPDLAPGDVLEWRSVVGGTDGDVTIYTNGSFEALDSVTSFEIRAHDGVEWSAWVDQTVGDPTPGDGSSNNIAELESESTTDIYFIFLDFANEPWRACTGTRTYSFNGGDWLGIGEIGGIGGIAEASDVAARPITLTLSGVDPFIVEPVLSRTNYKGREARIYRGFLNDNMGLVEAPIAVWTGRMDVGSVSLDAGEATAQITCESIASRLLRPNISRYSDQDHQLRYPGDKFFEYLPQLAQKDLVWGGMRVGSGGGGGRGNDDLRDRIWTIER